MNLDNELDQAFEHQLCDCAHAPESIHFVLLHPEKGFIRPLDAGEDTSNAEEDAEEKGKRLEDCCIDDEDLVHQEHEDDKSGADRAPSDYHQHWVALGLVSPQNSVKHELDHLDRTHIQRREHGVDGEDGPARVL